VILRRRAPAPPCGECPNLDPKPLDSGIRYCWGFMRWRWPHSRVAPCPYRGVYRPHELRKTT
jgi:hypothetical protein